MSKLIKQNWVIRQKINRLIPKHQEQTSLKFHDLNVLYILRLAHEKIYISIGEKKVRYFPNCTLSVELCSGKIESYLIIQLAIAITSFQYHLSNNCLIINKILLPNFQREFCDMLHFSISFQNSIDDTTTTH